MPVLVYRGLNTQVITTLNLQKALQQTFSNQQITFEQMKTKAIAHLQHVCHLLLIGDESILTVALIKPCTPSHWGRLLVPIDGKSQSLRQTHVIAPSIGGDDNVALR